VAEFADVAGYDLIRALSRRAEVETWLASRRGQEVVLRRYAARLDGPDDVIYFGQRALGAAALRQACIVPLSDHGRLAGHLYAAREHVAGGSLRERAGTLARFGDRLQVVSDIGRALAHAHQHGLVHGALHPDNVLLTERGEARLVDFPLVKDPPPTQFTAPEVRRGISDERVDQYSLGKLLAWLLAQGSDAAAAGELSELEEAMARATALDWRRRFVHLDELLEVVEAQIEHAAPQASAVQVEASGREIEVTVGGAWTREAVRACVEKLEAALAPPGPWRIAYVFESYRGYHQSSVITVLSELHRRLRPLIERIAFFATEPQARGLGVILGSSVEKLPWKAFDSRESMHSWLRAEAA
jgi:hypothetical protein